MALANWIKESTKTAGIDQEFLTLDAIGFRPRYLDVYAADEPVAYAILSADGNREEGDGFIRSGNILERTTPIVTWVADTSTYDDITPNRVELTGVSVVYVTLGASSSFLEGDNNLSDVGNAATALANLGGISLGQSVNFSDLLLPTGGVATSPTLSWGDGDTGLYESADDTLQFVSGGAKRMNLSFNFFSGEVANSWGLSNTTSNSTTPTILPSFRIGNGLGASSTLDEVYITAGGVTGLTVSEVAGVTQVILPGGTASTPTLAFGDGDTGWTETADDTLRLYNGGIQTLVIVSGFTQFGGTSPAPTIWHEGATATNPVYAFSTDADTGIGSAGSDQLSLIAGGVEGLRVTESAGAVQTLFNNGVVATPSISFQSYTTTGFYATGIGILRLALNGVNYFTFANAYFQGSATRSMYLYHGTSSLSTPTYSFLADADTGVHSPDVDQVSLVAGGVEGLRVTETAGIVTTDITELLRVNLTSDGAASAVEFNTVLGSGTDVPNDYTLKVTNTTTHANGTNLGLYVECANTSVNLALHVKGLTYMEGTLNMFGNLITNAGNLFMKDIPTANEGNLLVGDNTSNFAAGGGGVIAFSGDVVGQAEQGFRSVFASIQGIKETGDYQDSRGALVFGTQDLNADLAKLGTVTEKFRINYAGQLVSAVAGTASLPTYAFGDGDTGFFEDVDDSIKLSIAGAIHSIRDVNGLYSGSGTLGKALISGETGTSTVPIYRIAGDTNTGMGWGGADALSLIAGGVEGLRVTEDTGVITINAYGDIEIPNTYDLVLGAGGVSSGITFGGIHKIFYDATGLIFQIGNNAALEARLSNLNLGFIGNNITHILLDSAVDSYAAYSSYSDTGTILASKGVGTEVALAPNDQISFRTMESANDFLHLFCGVVAEDITDASATAGLSTLTKVGENFLTTCKAGDIVYIYSGGPTTRRGTNIITEVTSNEVLTIQSTFSGNYSDIDFKVYERGIAIENSRDQTAKLILPIDTDQTAPTLSFGDGDTGFYEQVDDELRLAIGGSSTYIWNATGIYAGSGGGILTAVPSSTVPSLVPSFGDLDTGIGRISTSDQLSLIAGGVEGLRIAEGNGDILHAFSGTEVESIFSASTTASAATLTKAGENFLTTCSVGDIVFVSTGTTAADHGTYIIKTVTSDTVLTVDRNFTGTNTNVGFKVITNSIAIENSRTGSPKFILPQINESTAPTLSFGDGSTGFYQYDTGGIRFSAGGAHRYTFEAAAINGLANDYAQIYMAAAASSTLPVFTFIGDGDTGIGRAAADQLSLIAGGVEGIRITETTGAITVVATDRFSAPKIAVTASNNTPTDVDLALGDPTTGFYVGSATQVRFAANGVYSFYFGQGVISSSSNFGAYVAFPINSTNPAYTWVSDGDTGLGRGAADSLFLQAGGVNGLTMTETAGVVQTIFPQVDSAASPTIAFGDGDSGFYEPSDDLINMAVGGSSIWQFSVNYLDAGITGGPMIYRETSTATNPVFIPYRFDGDTGLGGAGADQLSLIAGGVEGIRITETTGTIAVNMYGDVNISTIGDILSFGDGDTYIAEIAGDDNLSIYSAGVEGVRFLPTFNMSLKAFRGSLGNDAEVNFGTATTATVPAFIPSQADKDTGVGTSGADQLSLIAGGVEGIRITETAGATQVILQQVNDQTAPTLAFGDGDTGFFEQADDTLLGLSMGGASKFFFSPTLMYCPSGGGLRNTAATLTTPNLIPYSIDLDTGIGSGGGLDKVSMIAGGVNGLAVEEANGDILSTFAGTEVEKILNASTTASTATLTKAGENFLTTCSVGDVVFVDGGTTAADHGTYIIQTVTSDTVLTVDRNFSTTNTDVDFRVISNSVVIENSRTAGATLIVPQIDDQTAPTLAFGDGDTGFYESVDDQVRLSLGGNFRYLFTVSSLTTSAGSGPSILLENASATNPTFAPNSTDADTGIGWNSADQLSLIAGAVEGLRVVEAAGNINVTLPGTGTAASPALSFGDGDTGFWESADDTLRLAIGGVNIWTITSTYLGSTGTDYPMIRNEAATSTNPNITPSGGDSDTGIGYAGADSLSLIVGAKEGIRITEAVDIKVDITAGAGTGTYRPTGTLSIDTTSGATTAVTTEEDLISYTLPADTLYENGRGVRIRAWGKYAANANVKTARIRFGGTQIAISNNITASPNDQSFFFECDVIRTGASTQEILSQYMYFNTNPDIFRTTAAIATTGTIVIKITGQNGTASAGDITAYGMSVEYI